MEWRSFAFFINYEDIRAIFRNSWPVLGVMLFNFIVGYTDIYVAGLIGYRVQAIVGLTGQIFFLSIIIGNAMAVGTVALVSRAFGRGDLEEVKSLISQGVVLSVLIGSTLLGGVGIFSHEIVSLFGISENLIPEAALFLRIFSIAILPNYILIVGSAVFRATGMPRRAFTIMGISTLINVPGNFILTFGLGSFNGLGAAGIAYSTVIALSVGAVLTIWSIAKSWKGNIVLSKERLKQIVHISWPSAVLQFAFQGGILVLYKYLAALGSYSTIAMAAYTNGIRLESIIFLPAFAVNMAVGVLVGQSLGRGSIEQARRIANTAFLWTVIGLAPIAVFLFWQAPLVVGWLSNHPDVCLETVKYIRINTAFYPLLVMSIVFGGAIQGAGDTKGAMKIILLAVWLVRVPLAGILSILLSWGAEGIWWAMGFSMALQGVSMFLRFRGSAWYRAFKG
ncbi:MAG: MATE family efflux transporter [Syntrophobacterales bacterium]|nr:MATE family efflux transporter [Syntrophobacterales bacterium]